MNEGPEWTWPDASVPIPGVPAAIWAKLAPDAIVRLEHFDGDVISTRTEKQYLAQTAGAGPVITIGQTPAIGDTITSGMVRLSVPGDPVAPSGASLRQTTSMIAANGFGSSRPTLWAARWQLVAPAASPALAGSRIYPGGIVRQSGGVAAGPSEGPFWWYDDAAPAGWRISACRAGVQADGPKASAWDLNVHICGFLHIGTEIIPFFDGAILASLTGAQIQPNAGVSSFGAKAIALAAEAPGFLIDQDWVAWAR